MSSLLLSDPDGPALAAPPGLDHDFGYNGMSTVYVGTISVIFIITTLLVAARAYTSCVILKLPGWDDYTLWIGWMLTFALASSTIPAYQHGLGKHQWNVRRRELVEVLFWFNTITILFDFSFMLVKISIVTQFRRIFVPMNRRSFMWWGTWGLTILFAVFYTSIAFANISQCNPRAKISNPTLPGKCLDSNALRYSTSIFNAATDLIMLLMPQVSIWRLNLPLRRRLLSGLVFLIGIFALIASCVHIYWTYEISQTTDLTFVGFQFGLWAVAEQALGVICACLPSLPRFFKSTLGSDSQIRSCARTRNHGKNISSDGSRRRSLSRNYWDTPLEPLRRQRTDGTSLLESVIPDAERGIVKTVQIQLHTEDERPDELEYPGRCNGW